jgi:predicted SAM-dependent methyltransferase
MENEKGIGLHLGSGRKRFHSEGVEWINIDSNKEVNPDIVWDLENGLPDTIRYNSVDMIITEHLLEHIENFITLMREIHRVCKPNAQVYIKVPPAIYQDKPFEGAFRDPTHVRFFTERSFDYFDKRTPEGRLYDFPYFQVFSSEVIKPGVDPELEVKLVVVKGDKV